ncbi:MAG TPA: hypothetical protein VKR58_12430 [Aquella sp.]|nr:hypothetical protein [Aquella sp.]
MKKLKKTLFYLILVDSFILINSAQAKDITWNYKCTEKTEKANGKTKFDVSIKSQENSVWTLTEVNVSSDRIPVSESDFIYVIFEHENVHGGDEFLASVAAESSKDDHIVWSLELDRHNNSRLYLPDHTSKKIEKIDVSCSVTVVHDRKIYEVDYVSVDPLKASKLMSDTFVKTLGKPNNKKVLQYNGYTGEFSTYGLIEGGKIYPVSNPMDLHNLTEFYKKLLEIKRKEAL